MAGLELNPMLRSTVVEALTEETRGPEGRQSYSQLLSVLERSTTQVFRRLPNVLDRIGNFHGKKWKQFNNAVRPAANSAVVGFNGASLLMKPLHAIYVGFLYFGWSLGTIAFIAARLVCLAVEIGIICAYSAIVVVFLTLDDLLCYVWFKLFSYGLSSSYRQVDCFAKRNKFYYEEIKHLTWNWKSFGKIVRRYHTIILLWFFVFFPIIVYESSSHMTNANTIRIHYDLHAFADEYYEYIVAVVLTLLGFGDWYDSLFKQRPDLDILVEPFIPTAKVFNNDFVDNMSHKQVQDFLEKESFTFLQTDDQRVKLLLHQFHLHKIRLLMKAQADCVEGDHDAKKVYEMENYIKIQVREGQIMHGDHLVIVQPSCDDVFKYGVIIQKQFISPRSVPTWKELNMLWMTKLWLTEMQSRLLRTYIILFTIIYAINELVHCTMIPNNMTWIFVLVFQVTFGIGLLIFALGNIFTTFDAHLYDEKNGDVIDLYNNRFIRNANEENFKITRLLEVPNVDAEVLRRTMLNIRFTANYDPYLKPRKRFPVVVWNCLTTCRTQQTYGGLRFSDLMRVLERLCKANSLLSMEVRVQLYSYELGEEKIFEVLYYSPLEVLYKAKSAYLELKTAYDALVPHIQAVAGLLGAGHHATSELAAHFLICLSSAMALAASAADLLCLAVKLDPAHQEDVTNIFTRIDTLLTDVKPTPAAALPLQQVPIPLAHKTEWITAVKNAAAACHVAADAVIDTTSSAGCNDTYAAVRRLSSAHESGNILGSTATDAVKMVELLVSTSKTSAAATLSAVIPAHVNVHPVVVNHTTMTNACNHLNGLINDADVIFDSAIAIVQRGAAAGQNFSTLAAVIDVDEHSMIVYQAGVLAALPTPCEKVPLSTFVTKILNENQVVARKMISDITLQ